MNKKLFKIYPAQLRNLPDFDALIGGVSYLNIVSFKDYENCMVNQTIIRENENTNIANQAPK